MQTDFILHATLEITNENTVQRDIRKWKNIKDDDGESRVRALNTDRGIGMRTRVNKKHQLTTSKHRSTNMENIENIAAEKM